MWSHFLVAIFYSSIIEQILIDSTKKLLQKTILRLGQKSFSFKQKLDQINPNELEWKEELFWPHFCFPLQATEIEF